MKIRLSEQKNSTFNQTLNVSAGDRYWVGTSKTCDIELPREKYVDLPQKSFSILIENESVQIEVPSKIIYSAINGEQCSMKSLAANSAHSIQLNEHIFEIEITV